MLYTYFAGKDFLWEKKTMSSSYFFFLDMMHCYQLKYSKEHKRAPQPATSLRRYLR